MKLETPKNNDLLEAILSLETLEEARAFFRDLLTEKEIQETANRWLAVRLLSDAVPYVEIQKQTGLSSTTVARISKWLKSGMNGYSLVLNRLHHSHPSTKKR